MRGSMAPTILCRACRRSWKRRGCSANCTSRAGIRSERSSTAHGTAKNPGLLGSTEWVETHGDELQKHAVAYINSDGNGRGFFRASGSHDLEKLINDVIREIKDPEKDIPVWQRARLSRIANAKNQEERGEIRKRAELTNRRARRRLRLRVLPRPRWHFGAKHWLRRRK